MVKAINYSPKQLYSLVETCNQNNFVHHVGFRVLDDMIKDMVQCGDYEKYVNDAEIVLSRIEDGMQFYFKLTVGMIVDGVPTVSDVLFSSNVKDDFIKLITIKNES